MIGAFAVALADRVQREAERAAGHGASGPAALTALHGPASGASIDVLRRIVGLSHSGAVRLVDRLAEGGFVERRVGVDQRSVALWLTPAGRRAARRVLAQREAAVELALSVLTDGQRAELARAASAALPALVDSPDAERRVCRLCDTDACGRPRGECPVQVANATKRAS
jgi:MarR family transcriptional regulator, negative regulator of the multidrug operon emrRAB